MQRRKQGGQERPCSGQGVDERKEAPTCSEAGRHCPDLLQQGLALDNDILAMPLLLYVLKNWSQT